jgi:hypothetical protein
MVRYIPPLGGGGGIAGYQENINLTTPYTGSTAPVDVYSTGISVDIIQGQKIFAVFNGTVYKYNPNYWENVAVAIQDNGSDIAVTEFDQDVAAAYVYDTSIGVCALISPAPGAHTIRIRFRCKNSFHQMVLIGKLDVLVF